MRAEPTASRGGEQHVLPARQPALLKGPLLHHRGPKTQPKLHTIGAAERQLVCFNSILFVRQRLRDFANMRDLETLMDRTAPF